MNAPTPPPAPTAAPRRNAWVWILAIGTLLALVVILASGRRGGQAAFLVEVSLIAALLGGVLSLLSPCSAAMLPAFFAYAFKERGQLVRMTFVFWLGLALVFIPLGFGANLVGTLFITHRSTLFKVAALIFLAYALWSLFGHARQRMLPNAVREHPRSLASVFLMGILTAFATGTCTAPILGAIFTLAATQSSPVLTFILLGSYSLGLVVPLFLLAYGFERFGWKDARWVQGRLWTIPLPGDRRWFLHSSNLITALLFLFLAWVFWFGRGTYLFLAPLARSGLIDVVFTANQNILQLSGRTATIALVAIVAVLALIAWRRRCRTCAPPSSPLSSP